jgi:hypothetical protein
LTGKGQDGNQARVKEVLEKNENLMRLGLPEVEIEKAAKIIYKEDIKTIDDTNRSNYLITNDNGKVKVQIIEDPEKIVKPGPNQVFLKFANSQEFSMRQASTKNQVVNKADLDHETVMTVLQRQEQAAVGPKIADTAPKSKPNS